MKKLSILVSGLVLAGLILYASCGGGGGSGKTPPTPTNKTTFTGGTLADLQKLSSSLTFDELEITGRLNLPASFTPPSVLTTITANKLTITSTGSISYTYGNCDWMLGPSLTLNVTGDVVIDGNIELYGRYGITSHGLGSGSCEDCFGQDGGDVVITGNTIRVKGNISNSGGDGANDVSVVGSLHCGSGNSGKLKLLATTTLDLSGATISNKAGVGMDPSKNGSSGDVNITAGAAFTMRDGSIDSSGPMTFSAATTDIWGTIRYGSLNETIGGGPRIPLIPRLPS